MPPYNSKAGLRKRSAGGPCAPTCASASRPSMTTPFPYRNVLLLACCQALLLTNAAGLIAMSALVGFSLTETKALATLGATTYVLGSALSTMPASLWMARVGRRTGFMTGALINIGGCALAAVALWQHSFVLFCVATAVIGIYNAIGLQYRFAAAEVASAAAPREGDLARARGRHRRRLPRARDDALGPATCSPTPFLGSFVLLAGVGAGRARRAVARRTCRRRRSRSAPAAGGRSRRSCGSRCSSSRHCRAR